MQQMQQGSQPERKDRLSNYEALAEAYLQHSEIEDGRARWFRLVCEYLARKASGDLITRAEFVSSKGVAEGTFVTHLRANAEAAKEVLGLRDASRKTPRISLNERDVAILKTLQNDRANSLCLIANRFFNGSTERARSKLNKLLQARLIRASSGSRPVYYLTSRGVRHVGGYLRRDIHPRHLRHHVATLHALDSLRQQVERVGGHFVPETMADGRTVNYRLEYDIAAAERRGKATFRNQAYQGAVDASVIVAMPLQDGTFSEQRVALEYITRRYTDEQILEKLELSESFDKMVFVADSLEAAQRVTRLTGLACGVVSDR